MNVNKTIAINLLALLSIEVTSSLCKGANPLNLTTFQNSMQDTIYMGNSAPNPSRDVQIPDVPIPDVKIPGSDNTFKPQPFYSSHSVGSSNYVYGPTTYNTDPKLYKLDKEVFGEKTSSSFKDGHISTESMILAGSIFLIGLLTGIIILLLKRK